MNKPICINLFAGPGTGKSTTAAGVFSLLKMHDVNAELITEFAKDLTWEERYRTLHNQYYIWGKQNHKIWRVKSQVDVIITDSPCLLSLIYGKDNPQCFNDLILHSFNEGVINMNYFLIRMKPFNPKGRTQNIDEAKIIDDKITSMLAEYSIGFEIINGNYEGINDIANQILKMLDKEMKIWLCDLSI